MDQLICNGCGQVVALLAEGVDRNMAATAFATASVVALLAEGVDRNCFFGILLGFDAHVALLAEGVDRNMPNA